MLAPALRRAGRATTAYAIVRFRNGTIGRFPVALNRYGNGSASLRFSRFRRSSSYRQTLPLGE